MAPCARWQNKDQVHHKGLPPHQPLGTWLPDAGSSASGICSWTQRRVRRAVRPAGVLRPRRTARSRWSRRFHLPRPPERSGEAWWTSLDDWRWRDDTTQGKHTQAKLNKTLHVKVTPHQTVLFRLDKNYLNCKIATE